jgi:hypothetical protein
MELPDYGQWIIPKSAFGPKPPFVGVTVSFADNAGAVQSPGETTQLKNVVRLAPNRFGARYNIGSHHGRIDAVLEDDETLTVMLVGTANCRFRAEPTQLVHAAD